MNILVIGTKIKKKIKKIKTSLQTLCGYFLETTVLEKLVGNCGRSSFNHRSQTLMRYCSQDTCTYNVEETHFVHPDETKKFVDVKLSQVIHSIDEINGLKTLDYYYFFLKKIGT